MIRKKLIITGIVIVITFIAFLWGFNYLKGQNMWIKKRTYYAIYKEVGGLNLGSPVTIKGLKIGQINKIEFVDDYANAVLVSFIVNKDYKIPYGSKAQIFNADILGTKGLRITPSDSHKFYKPGDTLKSSIEISMIDDLSNNLGPLKNKSEDLVTNLDSLSVLIKMIITNNAVGLNNTFVNLNQISQNLDFVSKQLKDMTSESGKITKIINNLEEISSTLKGNDENINRTLTNISDISDSLKSANIQQTLNELSIAIDQLNSSLTKINTGEGTLGKLVNDDTLYTNIQNLAINLDSLVKDIKAHPRKYLRVSVIDMSTNK